MISSTQTNQPFAGEKPKRELHPSAFLQTALERLRASGLRITQPRIKLLRALSESESPLTIDELHAQVKSECDLVTVYRCVLAFEDLQLVRRTYRYNGTTLYECDTGNGLPFRVMCKATNRVEELDPATTKDLAAAVQAITDTLRARGYSKVSHVVEFFGSDGTTLATNRTSDLPSAEPVDRVQEVSKSG